jgi:thiamine biosynthesis protein ThiI
MKFVSLVSSGIDSPVATYLLSNKVEEIIIMHTDNRPFTDDNEIENFQKIIKQLKKHIVSKIKIYIVHHGDALSSYKTCCEHRFTCVFCKRMMLRYAEKIAENNYADALIMGDSLGQVASQTLQNLKVIEQTVSIPILRPLIGFDKEDIIKIAKKIGTYNLSILPSKSCCAVPKKPATQAKIEQILSEEKKINIAGLVDDSLKHAVVSSI